MAGFLKMIRLMLEGVGLISLAGLAVLLILDPEGLARVPERIIQKAVERKNALFGMSSLFASPERPRVQTAVVVDQLGYRPGDPKAGFVKGNRQGRTFELVDVTTKRTVFSGVIQSSGVMDANTGEVTSVMDFSSFATPGGYFIRIPGAGLQSGEFRIDEAVYRPAFTATLESFYYQRCGAEIDIGTVWKHPPCHTAPGVFYLNRSETRDVTGGWHDAGDHGKYVVTGAPSAAFMLYLYERQPERFPDGQLSIPESGNGMPDILDEARWELEWLLKFQREDGAVYHKVAAQKWSGNYMPHLDPDVYYINPVSSAATGDFAAVCALASRLFSEWDKPFAYRLFKASLSAWAFLTANPDIVPPGGFKNPPGVEGGDYSDGRDLDERLWAAVELYRLTGSQKYHDYFVANYKRAGFYMPFGWQNVDSFAFGAYLHLPSRLRNQGVYDAILAALRGYADGRTAMIEQNGYRHVLKPDEFYWGSNSVALGEAFKLIQAYEATGQAKYLHGALDQLHYILGRNTFNIAFVTGVGSNPVLFPYHQFSIKLGADAPVPGMAVGGPNSSNAPDGRKLSEFPGRSYEDNVRYYQVNEVAINYTAPLVFLAGYFAP